MEKTQEKRGPGRPANPLGKAQVMAISIPQGLLKRLDRKVRRKGGSRSSHVCAALMDWLDPKKA